MVDPGDLSVFGQETYFNENSTFFKDINVGGTITGNLIGNITGNVNGDINSSGVSTFTNGPVLIGSGTSTGTASQPLQVIDGAYVSGNLGIGNTNPSYPVQIGSGSFTNTSGKSGFAFDVTNTSLFTTFGTGGSLSLRAQPVSSTGGGEIFIGGSTRGDNLVNCITFSTNNSEKIRLDSNGRLGIGTSNPSDTLEVNGGTVVPSVRTISSKVRYGTGLSYRDTTNTTRPILHVFAGSYGLSASGTLGQTSSVFINGVNVFTCGRSWGLTVISGAGSTVGEILHAATYDIFGNAALESTFITALSTYNTNNNVLIVNTQDEPEQSAGTLRTTLQNTYGAKFAAAPTNYRYAYAYAFRNGYGALAEQHSAYFAGATLTAAGSNDPKSVASINFTVVL